MREYVKIFTELIEVCKNASSFVTFQEIFLSFFLSFIKTIICSFGGEDGFNML
jgi:hypothetical protein